MGGKVASNDGFSAGWASAFSGDAVNSNLTNSVRIIAKFGSSPTSWTPSTSKPVPGNGAGSFSGGAGGPDAFLLGTSVGDITGANENTLLTFSTNQHFDGSSVFAINANVGRYIYTLDGNGLLDSWSVYLNTSLLSAIIGPGIDVPMTGDGINLTLQRSTNSTLFTDARGTVAAAVPEVSSFVLFGLPALGLLGAWRTRRQNQ